MNEPKSPTDTYKAFIDQLVNETRINGEAALVAERAIFSNAPAHREFNDLIAALAPPQRAVLARMLSETRDAAIHDVLAALSWWVDAREVGLTFLGKPMPVGLSGMGLHGDYVGRRDGWDWPE